MFQVGANNPNVGNDRRKQLLNALAQQLAQRHQSVGLGGGAGQLGGVFLNRKRQQNPFVSAQTRMAGAGRQTAGTQSIAGGNVPNGVADGLGVGGYMRPTPPAPSLAGIAGGQLSPVTGHPIAPSGGSAGVGSVPIPGGPPVSQAPGSASPQAAISAVQGSEPNMGSQPSAAFGGLVPLGNGIFINPATGQVFGGNGAALPMGSLAGHLAAGRDAGGY